MFSYHSSRLFEVLCFPVKALHSRAGRGARARHGPGEEKPSLGGSRQGLGPEALRLRRLISVVFGMPLALAALASSRATALAGSC